MIGLASDEVVEMFRGDILSTVFGASCKAGFFTIWNEVFFSKNCDGT
jgi:hypothetical protein